MRFCVVTVGIGTIYECSGMEMESKGQVVSAIADEGLHGMLMEVTGDEVDGFLPVRTFYGYKGYIQEKAVRILERNEAEEWECSDLKVVSGGCVDVVSIPRVQGVRLISLVRGCMVQVLEWDSEEAGWAKVCLADGRIGYVRNQYLGDKWFSQSGVWEGTVCQRRIMDEEQFRRDVVETAKSFLGTQYRWGGRSTAGIDCSGLTSVSYMMNGILTYRDAKIVDGYPVHEISKEDKKPGDLLYFPGHIAMYVGDGMYIHSTGRIGSGGVVYNSFCPESPLYRQDLVDSLYAVGSIFPMEKNG